MIQRFITTAAAEGLFLPKQTQICLPVEVLLFSGTKTYSTSLTTRCLFGFCRESTSVDFCRYHYGCRFTTITQ